MCDTLHFSKGGSYRYKANSRRPRFQTKQTAPKYISPMNCISTKLKSRRGRENIEAPILQLLEIQEFTG